MKKNALIRKIIVTVAMAIFVTGCNTTKSEVIKFDPVNTPGDAILRLVKGNDAYVKAMTNNADISLPLREKTATEGQTPYAVIITCSDSRVPPEHIFSAGVGELFVIRTAGNVVGTFELGSIEYGAEHLGAKAIVILGHSKCGAVDAAIKDAHVEGCVADIVKEIKPGISGAENADIAENLNIKNSYNKIKESEIIAELSHSGKVVIRQAKYDIATGKVSFLD
jgi:carbonic anhydrase|uniref:carbonic anhydrase n=1 Tax=uncultured bacterium contig00117 TaxID=1181578 RepID=A0A806KBA9_9BACT|nr:carbonic anhydrase [uncultured bacterium contig00117]